jgi:hypothetical protein
MHCTSTSICSLLYWKLLIWRKPGWPEPRKPWIDGWNFFYVSQKGSLPWQLFHPNFFLEKCLRSIRPASLLVGTLGGKDQTRVKSSWRQVANWPKLDDLVRSFNWRRSILSIILSGIAILRGLLLKRFNKIRSCIYFLYFKISVTTLSRYGQFRHISQSWGIYF